MRTPSGQHQVTGALGSQNNTKQEALQSVENAGNRTKADKKQKKADKKQTEADKKQKKADKNKMEADKKQKGADKKEQEVTSAEATEQALTVLMSKDLLQPWDKRKKVINSKEFKKWQESLDVIFSSSDIGLDLRSSPDDKNFCETAILYHPAQARATWIQGCFKRGNYDALMFVFANNNRAELAEISKQYDKLSTSIEKDKLSKQIRAVKSLGKSYTDALLLLISDEKVSNKSVKEHSIRISSNDSTGRLQAVTELFCLESYQIIRNVAKHFKEAKKTTLSEYIAKKISCDHPNLACLCINILQRAECQNSIYPLLKQAITAFDEDKLPMVKALLHALDYAPGAEVAAAVEKLHILGKINESLKDQRTFYSFLYRLCTWPGQKAPLAEEEDFTV